ncbi:MAG: serine hydrolase [Candidatus Eremiobacteraeota bacterium]|nr:serine hydrolase [Candidatus Eremiobacteraeota bacterium]
MAVSPAPKLNFDAALAYAERHKLHALVAARGGKVGFECYGPMYAADTPHAIFSGTKSFWGIVAVAAQEDGLLKLDEQVAGTIHEWEENPRKELVTIRDLLNLTAGFGFGGLGRAVPVASVAIGAPLQTMPGATFTYGGIPLQIFGEVLRRKLATRNLEPHDYLRERILDPLGLEIAAWRTLKDGTRPLPTGATLAPLEWLKFGQLLLGRGSYKGKKILQEGSVAACFEPARANPRYGLGFWLSPFADDPGIVYASGSGGQALYVLFASDTVVVHFGDGGSWKHETFLKKLLGRG